MKKKTSLIKLSFQGFFALIKEPALWPKALAVNLIFYLLFITFFYVGFEAFSSFAKDSFFQKQVDFGLIGGVFFSLVLFFFFLIPIWNLFSLSSFWINTDKKIPLKSKIKIIKKAFLETLLIKLTLIAIACITTYFLGAIAFLIFFVFLAFMITFESLLIGFLLDEVSLLKRRELLKKSLIPLFFVCIVEGIFGFFSFLTILLWLFWMPSLFAGGRSWAKELNQ